MSDSEKNFSGSADESSKPPLLVKKKKKSEKPGYKMFDAEDSDDAPVMFDDSVRPSSTKLKKHGRPSFKFSGKIKLKEKEKEDKKDIGDKRDEKDFKKITIRKFKDKDKDSKEHKIRKKKDKVLGTKTQIPSIVAAEIPVFGVALSLAVERTPSHDGIMLPVIVRECIDYIEEHGLLYEGIYRISGVKSKVQMLKDAYNRQQPAYLFEHDPSIVASLLKQFLRELPEPLLTNDLNSHFEEASVLKTSKERLERLNQCISSLPPCNRELLSWMIVHMNHVIAKEKTNKMSLQNVSIVLSPTMRISHRVLNILFMHSDQLFSHVKIIRYRPPLATAASKWSVDMPETAEAIEEELHKQESLLNKLHQELSHSHSLKNSEKEDRVWEVQRAVTQLKRKLKLIAKTQAARQLEQAQLATSKVQRADPNRRSINAAELNFALQSGSLRRTHRTSQAELASASSTASIAASTEGLHSLHKQSAAAEPSAVSSHSKKGAASEIPPSTANESGDTPAPLTTDQSSADPPSRDQFITGEPSASHLAADQPLAGHLAADQPLAGHLAADQPLAGHLAADQPLAGHLAADQPLPSSSPNNLPLSADVSNTTETGNEVKEDIQTSPQTQALPTPESEVAVNTADNNLKVAENADLVYQECVAEADLEIKRHPTDGAESAILPEQMKSIKVSTSQDSDITLSPYTDEGVHESTSQQSLSDFKPLVSSTVSSDRVELETQLGDQSQISEAAVQEPTLGLTATDQSEVLKPQTIQSLVPVQTTGLTMDPGTAMLLIPEKLHAGVDNSDANRTLESHDQLYNIADDDELRLLIAEEAQLIWEEEELIAIQDELRHKINTENIEIERLQEEIIEYEELRSITTLGHSSETMSSDEYYSSTSDTEPEDESAAQAELDNLVMTLMELTQQNEECEAKNAEMVKKIHEERMGCVNVKIQIRLLQQQMLGAQAEEQSLI